RVKMALVLSTVRFGVFYAWKNGYNKAFKSDSQRLAFFIPTLGFVFTVVWLGSVVALLTP
ncbi:hypothetical protein P3470_23005, partial [Vibrio parahaemolyticus]|nr:hypothetical protein [Vibrio parahaemolyticus]